MLLMKSRRFFAGLLPALALTTVVPLAVTSAPAGATSVAARAPVKESAARLLVTPKGRTLYAFAADSPNKSTCYGKCAKAWLPRLVANGTTPPAKIRGIPGTFGVTMRTDGTQQLTYDGAPLYTFILDKEAGDIYGQGIFGQGAYWWAVVAGGMK